jgi:hypothetical protein
VRLDCKDRPDPKACVERLARPDNLECPAHLECLAPRAKWPDRNAGLSG